MAARKIRHWKHGWIPVSPEAKAYVAGKGPKPLTGRGSIPDDDSDLAPNFARAKERVAAFRRQMAQERDSGKADAVRFLPGDVPMSADEKAEVAAVVGEVYQRLPGLKRRGPVEVDKTFQQGSWAQTAVAPPHGIDLNPNMWDDEQVERNRIEWSFDHGALAGEAKDVAEFRKMAIVHEMGHFVHLRDEDDERKADVSRTAVAKLASEPVTPRQMGYELGEGLDNPVPRWMADSLGRRSAYAVSGSPYEWYAEAFLDGYMNGDKASPSGQRAYRLAQQLYGKEATS